MSYYSLARAITNALLDGPWSASAMRERLQQMTGGVDEPWLYSLVDAACDDFEEAPTFFELAMWIHDRDVLHDAASEGTQVRQWPLPQPEMRDSPWRVPTIATVKDLARWFGLEVRALDALADRRGIARARANERGRHYRYTWVAKPSGGHRLLEAPKPRLRQLQRYVLDEILVHIPAHDAAHGFRPKRSVLTFAAPHVRREVVIKVDLETFFTSVFAAQVAAIFRTAGYPDDVAQYLTMLCTHRTPGDILGNAPSRDPGVLARLRTPHLPQGAPTSGALANLAAYRLDVRVAAFAATIDAHYTRYADDLVLSGPRHLVRAAPSIVARLGAIAIEQGFALNFRKTRVMTAAGRQRIAGIVVNEQLAVSRADVDRLRAILHHCARTGPTAQNRDGHADFRAYLLGRVSWVTAVDARKGNRLRALFDQIRWD